MGNAPIPLPALNITRCGISNHPLWESRLSTRTTTVLYPHRSFTIYDFEDIRFPPGTISTGARSPTTANNNSQIPRDKRSRFYDQTVVVSSFDARTGIPTPSPSTTSSNEYNTHTYATSTDNQQHLRVASNRTGVLTRHPKHTNVTRYHSNVDGYVTAGVITKTKQKNKDDA